VTTETTPHTPGQRAGAETLKAVAFVMLAVGVVVLLVLTLAGPLGRVVESIWPTSEVATELRYADEGGLQGAITHVDPVPHDCEFLSAPLGSKNCHYEKLVRTFRVRRRPDQSAEGSYDEGKTWMPVEASATPQIVVSWRKVAE
jgi:hypothetical protein